MLCLVLMAVELVIVSTALQSANYTAYKPSTGRPPLQLPRVGPLAPFRHGRQARVAEREVPQAPGDPPHPQGRARPQVTPQAPGPPVSAVPRDPPAPPGAQGIRPESCFPHAGSDPPATTSPRLPDPTLEPVLSSPRAPQLLLAE